MTYYLAIDIGASSGRHIVGWLENGKLNIKEVYRFANGARRINGRQCWSVDILFEQVKKGLRVARELGFQPQFVGIDTWAVDYALLDEHDHLLDNVYCYRDSRTQEVIRSVHDMMPFAQLYEVTGIQFQPFNTIYQLYADKFSGKLGRAKSFLMLPDYLNFLLTGIKKQEYTNATSTGMVNAKTHNWDGNILYLMGFDKNLFGQLSQPGECVGYVCDEVAKEIGYKPIVMLPATHDTASAVLAAPLDGQTPYISSGTWSLLGVESNSALTDEKSLKANYSNEGSINYSFRYQKNIMGLWMIQSVKRELFNRFDYHELSQMARSKPKTLTVDVNDHRFLSPENMINEITRAIDRKVGTASLMRIIYDSLAKCYADAIDELEQNTNTKFGTINIIGGGSQDEFLNELTAKATGKKVITGPVEGTAIGNLAMQMIGCGEVENLQVARKIIKNSFDIREVKYE